MQFNAALDRLDEGSIPQFYHPARVVGSQFEVRDVAVSVDFTDAADDLEFCQITHAFSLSLCVADEMHKSAAKARASEETEGPLKRKP